MAKIIYNQLSDEFKKRVKWDVPPGRDEVIEFQVIEIPIVKQNGEMLPVYGNRRIPNVDSVYDPGANNGKGGMVQIAYVLRETGNENKPYDLGEIEFLRTNKGVITITGREPAKYGLLYFLRACNYNESNPLAGTTSSGYIFRELEPTKTAEQKLKDRRQVNECMNLIDEMKESEIVSILAALKEQVKPSFIENQSTLVEFIQDKSKREKFLALSKDARTPVAALISKAEALEIIRFEKDPKMWIYVKTKLSITQVTPQTEKYEHLINYFHNDKKGRIFKDFLEKEVESINAVKAKNDAEEELVEAEGSNVKK